MTKKKRLLYVVLAVVLIIAGIYMDKGAAVKDNAKSLLTAGATESTFESSSEDYVEYYFRNDDLLEQHYEKHGMEMGFESMEAYEEAACAVVYHPDVLTKTEMEDGDYVYYVEETNEFVVISQDGYIRTYFNPSAGIDYYNRQ